MNRLWRVDAGLCLFVRDSSRRTGPAEPGWSELEPGGGSLSEDTSGELGLDGHGVGPQRHCERFHLLLFYWDCQGNFTAMAGESGVLHKLGGWGNGDHRG